MMGQASRALHSPQHCEAGGPCWCVAIIISPFWTLQTIQSVGKMVWDVSNSEVKTTRDTPLWKASHDPLGLFVVYSKAEMPKFRVPPTAEALGWSMNKRNSVEETSHRCLATYCGKRKPDYQKYTISSTLCPSNLEESQVYKKKYAPKKSAFRYVWDSAIVVFLKSVF